MFEGIEVWGKDFDKNGRNRMPALWNQLNRLVKKPANENVMIL